MHPSKQRIIDVFGKEPETLDEVAQSVIAIIRDNGYDIKGFAWQIHYKSMQNNSHSCPLCGVENFCRMPHMELGYPGLHGRVWLRFDDRPKGFGSSTTNGSLLHTGSGGAGSYKGPWHHMVDTRLDDGIHLYSYECTLWLSDWPIIERLINRDMLIPILKKQAVSYAHSFEWTDEESKKQDNLRIYLHEINNGYAYS